jgi:hypothetical protein
MSGRPSGGGGRGEPTDERAGRSPPTRVVYLRDRAAVTAARQAGILVRMDRRTPWGNPFRIGRDGDRAQVIARYRDWIRFQPDLLARIPSLRGKVLACWCAPLPCHGDVLAALADAIPSPSAGA